MVLKYVDIICRVQPPYAAAGAGRNRRKHSIHLDESLAAFIETLACARGIHSPNAISANGDVGQ